MNRDEYDAARLEGIRLGLRVAEKESAKWFGRLSLDAQEILANIRSIDPDTIARKAVLDQLTSEAQEQNMGYDNEPR